MKYKFNSTYQKQLADFNTVVSIYANLRDVYPESILLESTDFHNRENCFSYICCNPIASFEIQNRSLEIQSPNTEGRYINLDDKTSVPSLLKDFVETFETDLNLPKFPFATHGVFGYTAFEAVQYFENINFKEKGKTEVPDMVYKIYQNIIVIDHFKDEMYIFEHQIEGIKNQSHLPNIKALLQKYVAPSYPFKKLSEEKVNISDEDFLDLVNKGKEHCQRGDVFQVVFSRRFSLDFQGDVFNVYRALRTINPSPYLFYFDYGNFQLLGSSPETQLEIKNNKATIHPIAGTFKRTGKDEDDLKSAKALQEDPKENAEHIMLVDLARNDLSRHCEQVKVEKFQEVQFFSHVIHLVSEVTGMLDEKTNMIELMADTFPAGTLSGAPKPMALELINRYEPTSRGYYGGAIGLMDFEGNFNHAIMIRSFLAQNNTLHYQAGVGIVAKSVAENELQEVNNKLRALKIAIETAEEVSIRF